VEDKLGMPQFWSDEGDGGVYWRELKKCMSCNEHVVAKSMR
jgi:hypothetical protein